MKDRTQQDDVRRIRELLESGGETTSDDDIALGRLALEQNFLTADQLSQLGQDLRDARARGQPSTLPTLILSRGWMQPDELLRLTSEQARQIAAAPRLARYEVRECVGEGASAVVYRAWDRELKRLVALKVLRAAAGMSGVARNRFKREASAAANLVHPNVVAVYDAAEEAGTMYLVMELIEGRTLLSLLTEAATPKKTLISILEQAARGIAAAHEKGVVHRDLKPANILVAAGGAAKVADFGLAHLMDSQSALTRSGAELGTPYYMSPEQVDGRSKEATPATDVYALGAILYEILTGSPPHARPSLQETFAAILSQDPAPLRSSDPKIHSDLETICLKALEKDPGRRYPSAREFAHDLHAYLAGEFISAVPTPRWKRRLRRALKNRLLVAAAVVVLAVCAIAGITLIRQSAASATRLAAERDLAKRRESALQRLGSLQATILERDRELRQLRVPVAQARREIDTALAEVDRMVNEWPDFPQGYYVRARGRILGGDLERAERDLRTAVAKEAAFRPGWSLLGLLKVGEYQSKMDGPRRSFDERVKTCAPVLEEAKACFARSASGGKELEEAARWGLVWTREDRVMERLSRAFQRFYYDKDKAGAIAILEEGDKEYQAEEYAMWIGILSGPGKMRTEWLNTAIQRAPGFMAPYYFRGTYALDARDYQAAISDFDRVLATRSSDAGVYDKRGEARRNLGDLDGALFDCTKSVELAPSQSFPWLNRATVYAQLGKRAEALADFDHAIALAPQLPEAFANRGIAKVMFDDPAGGLEDFSRAIQLDPNLPGPYRHRGVLYLKENRIDAAIADLDRAIKLDPGFYSAYEARAVAREGVGNTAGAIKDYEDALRLAPADWPKRKQIEGRLQGARLRLKDKQE